MKTIEELKNYYDTALKDDLVGLEYERKKVAAKVRILHIICGMTAGVSALLFFVITFFTLIILIPDIIIWIVLYHKFTKNYVSSFKTDVIEKIIHFIDSKLTYEPNSRISKETYMSSKIFRTRPDRYNGDDLVYGKIDKTAITFSELHSEYKTESRSSNGTRTTTYHTIFKGIFFIADFNKRFKGETFVLPDRAQKMFGNMLGNVFQSWNKMRGQLVKMEDPEFERYFVVYGSDQIEARYILSTSLMKRITDYRKSRGKEIYLSFINNQLFVAISYMKNLFEPKLFKTLLDFNLIKEYYEDLLMAVSIVDELNLNTRIWG